MCFEILKYRDYKYLSLNILEYGYSETTFMSSVGGLFDNSWCPALHVRKRISPCTGKLRFISLKEIFFYLFYNLQISNKSCQYEIFSLSISVKRKVLR